MYVSSRTVVNSITEVIVFVLTRKEKKKQNKKQKKERMKYILILSKTNSPIVYVEFFFSLVLVVAVNICTHVFYFILFYSVYLFCGVSL